MTTTIPTTNPRAERARIYREAKKNGQRVTVRVFSSWVEVTYHPEPTSRINYLREFTNWLNGLQYGRPQWLPEYLKGKDKDYIRTCISKSGLDVRYESGAITRMPAALRKQDGQVVLRIRDEVVLTFPCTRVCYLRKHERDQICERLEASGLGLRFEDL
jgi:hypothetical protein